MTITPDGKVGIGTGSPNNTLDVNGTLAVWSLGTTGSTPLCWNSGTFQISNCSSSSLRYKRNIAPFSSGMNVINLLRPITYDWKMDGTSDIGFGAEDIAKIDPRFVIYGPKGEIDGVRYDRLSVVFVNALKEQQAQIEAQQKKIENQELMIEALRKLVCKEHAGAEVCKEDK
jgi:hypothetical protein